MDLQSNEVVIGKIVTKLMKEVKKGDINTLKANNALFNLFNRLSFYYHQRCVNIPRTVDEFLEGIDSGDNS